MSPILKEDKRINNVFITPLGKEMFVQTRPMIKKNNGYHGKRHFKKRKTNNDIIIKKNSKRTLLNYRVFITN